MKTVKKDLTKKKQVGDSIMAKLCPRGKAAAKSVNSKFTQSAYANMYASAVCSGKSYTRWQKEK